MNRYIHIQGYFQNAQELFSKDYTDLTNGVVLVTSYTDFDVSVGDVLSFKGTTLNIIDISNTISKRSLQELGSGYNGFLLVKSNETSIDFIKLVLDEVIRFNQSNFDTKMWIISKEEYRKRQLKDILDINN